MTLKLAIDHASAAERPIIDNMIQLYIHDFSELFAGTPRCDLETDGRYDPEIPVGDWWRLADHRPLLIRVDGQLAGFVLLNAKPHSGRACDHNIAEFFVVRKYRRQGVGQAAAHTVFSRWPGQWEAAVMRTNAGAKAFWHRAITSHPRMSRIEAGDRNHFTWNGTIFRFDIEACRP